MTPRLLLTIGLLLAARAGLAQQVSLDDELQQLLDKAMQLNITARVLPPDETPAWNVKDTKLTLPGRSVAVKMTGTNARIDVILTPYLEANGTLLLLAQGQVWLSDAPDKQVKYLTTLKSIPLSWGEKVLFYPLGITHPVPDQPVFNIQLEIQVLPYKAKTEGISN